MRGYCLRRNLTLFAGNEHEVCFDWTEAVPVTQPAGSEPPVSVMDGCDRFEEGVCDRALMAVAGCGIAVAALWIGDIYSEKVKLNAIMLTIASVFGLIAVGVWYGWAKNAEFPMDNGVSLALAATATATSIVSAVLGYLDGYCIEGRRPLCDCSDDGIGYTGRLGAILSTITWTLYLCGLATLDWSTTSNVGAAGGFCQESLNSTTACYPAEFGLWGYCVSPNLVEFDGGEYRVCFKWDEAVQMAGQPEAADGLDRFDAFDIAAKREATAALLICAILLICAGDAFSEKLGFCAIVNLVAALFGTGALAAWVTFQRDLADGTGAYVEMGQSGFLLVGGWFINWATTILYFVDWRCNLDERLFKHDAKSAGDAQASSFDSLGDGSGTLEMSSIPPKKGAGAQGGVILEELGLQASIM